MEPDGSIDQVFRCIPADKNGSSSPMTRRFIGSAMLFFGTSAVVICLPLFALAVALIAMGLLERGFALPCAPRDLLIIALVASLIGAGGSWLLRDPALGRWRTFWEVTRGLLESSGVFGAMLALSIIAVVFTWNRFGILASSPIGLEFPITMLVISLVLLTATSGRKRRPPGWIPMATGVVGRLLAHAGWIALVLSMLIFPPAVGLASIGFMKDQWYLIAMAGAVYGPAFVVFGLILNSSPKNLALFLRRFGNADLNLAIRRAVQWHLGFSFRLITLDDLSFRPAGSPAGPKAIAVAAISLATMTAWLAAMGVFWTLKRVQIAESVETDFWVPGAIDGMEGWYFELFLDGVASGVIVDSLYFVGLGGFVAVAVLLLGRRSRLTVSKTRDLKRVERQAKRLKSWWRGPRLFAPQATVVKVANELWQGVVTSLVREATTVIIDISVPSESIIWELRSITVGSTAKVILLGRTDLLLEWLSRARAGNPADCEMLDAARGHSLITYSLAAQLDVRTLAATMADH